jgi:hypothetical protein
MRCFEVLHQALSIAYDRLPPGRRDDLIQQRQKALSQAYRNLETNPQALQAIDYRDPATRFAYMFTYVAYHAATVARLFEILYGGYESVHQLFNQPRLKVSCLGGGPGSEVLGLYKFLRAVDPPGLQTVAIDLIDRVNHWAEEWPDTVMEALHGAAWHLVPTYYSFDLTQPKDWKGRQRHLRADLFLLVFLLSELLGHKAEAEPFFEDLLGRAASGSQLFYVDNNAWSMHGWFDALLETHGWETVAENSGPYVMPSDEDKADLGEFLDRFEFSPRLTGDIFWKLARKP